MSISHIITLLRLARHLGPWGDERDVMPICTEDIEVASTKLRLFVHPKRKHRHAIFLIPGLHFLGPDHQGITRLAHVYANAGYIVGVPFLRDFIALQIKESVLKETKDTFEVFLSRCMDIKPMLMCISFGTLPALEIASHKKFRDRVGGVFTFGGYLDWRTTMEFCLFEEPLSQTTYPVIFKLLSPFWEGEVDIVSVDRAWNRYIHATWNIEEMENNESARRGVAEELASHFSSEERQLFLQGCGLVSNWEERARFAMKNSHHLDWLDNHERVREMRSPLMAVHGAGDEISPPSQSIDLVKAYSHSDWAQAFVTGLYGHSRQNVLQGIKAQFSEANTMLGIVRGILRLSTS